MKRYTVVMNDGSFQPDPDSPFSNIFVEYYWAEDFSHAEEQAKDANPLDVQIVAITHDANILRDNV